MSKHLSELYIKMKGQFHERLLAFTAHDSVFFSPLTSTECLQ